MAYLSLKESLGSRWVAARLPRRLKPGLKEAVIAALKRCATQKQLQCLDSSNRRPMLRIGRLSQPGTFCATQTLAQHRVSRQIVFRAAPSRASPGRTAEGGWSLRRARAISREDPCFVLVRVFWREWNP